MIPPESGMWARFYIRLHSNQRRRILLLDPTDVEPQTPSPLYLHVGFATFRTYLSLKAFLKERGIFKTFTSVGKERSMQPDEECSRLPELIFR